MTVFSDTANFKALSKCSVVNGSVIPGLWNFSTDDTGVGLDGFTLINVSGASSIGVSAYPGKFAVANNNANTSIHLWSIPPGASCLVESTDDFDISVKLENNANENIEQTALCLYGSPTQYLFAGMFYHAGTGGNLIRFTAWNDSSVKDVYSLHLSTTMWVRLTRVSGALSMYYKDNEGDAWTQYSTTIAAGAFPPLTTVVLATGTLNTSGTLISQFDDFRVIKTAPYESTAQIKDSGTLWMDAGSGKGWDLYTAAHSLTGAPGVKYQYYSSNTSSDTPVYNGTWLTLAELQALGAVAHRYLWLQVQITGDASMSFDSFTLDSYALELVPPEAMNASVAHAEGVESEVVLFGVALTGHDVGIAGWQTLTIEIQYDSSWYELLADGTLQASAATDPSALFQPLGSDQEDFYVAFGMLAGDATAKTYFSAATSLRVVGWDNNNNRAESNAVSITSGATEQSDPPGDFTLTATGSGHLVSCPGAAAGATLIAVDWGLLSDVAACFDGDVVENLTVGNNYVLCQLESGKLRSNTVVPPGGVVVAGALVQAPVPVGFTATDLATSGDVLFGIDNAAAYEAGDIIDVLNGAELVASFSATDGFGTGGGFTNGVVYTLTARARREGCADSAESDSATVTPTTAINPDVVLKSAGGNYDNDSLVPLNVRKDVLFGLDELGLLEDNGGYIDSGPTDPVEVTPTKDWPDPDTIVVSAGGNWLDTFLIPATVKKSIEFGLGEVGTLSGSDASPNPGDFELLDSHNSTTWEISAPSAAAGAVLIVVDALTLTDVAAGYNHENIMGLMPGKLYLLDQIAPGYLRSVTENPPVHTAIAPPLAPPGPGPGPVPPVCPTKVFRRVWVDNVMRGGSLIYWEMHPDFIDPGPWVFQAQWGRTVGNEWADVAVDPVTDGYYTLDPQAHLWAKQLDLYYRVRITTGAGRTFYSDAARADGGMPERDWRLAREIIRKEYLQYLKNPGGARGCLLKRRNWGDRCPVCTDYDSGEVQKPNCTVCYGTGIVGGYYTPVDYWILWQQTPSQRLSKGADYGMTGDMVTRARSVAYPHVESGDIWVSADNDQRWVINTVEEASMIRTRSLVLNLELKLAPASSILYAFPLDGCGAGGSAREPSSACGTDGCGCQDTGCPDDFCLPPVSDV